MGNFRKIISRKLNKKGFSLVEVLVTIAIIGLAIVPLIASFILSIRLNIRAWNVQNATFIAQNVSESFKAMTMEQLIEKYGEPEEELSPETNAATGRLVFRNIGSEEGINYFKEADSRRYYVTVILDPGEYKDNIEENIPGINDYKIPDLSDLYTDSVHGPIVLKSDIVRYDNEVLSKFGISESERQYVTKETVVSLECESITENFVNYYFMDCYLDITYTYTNPVNGHTSTYEPGRKIIETYTLEGSEETPPVYICYSTFDTYTTIPIEGSVCGASDKFSFEYDYSGESADERQIDVYLVQQETGHSDTALGYTSALKIDNVEIDSDVEFCTNVLNSTDKYGSSKDITSGEKTIESLYKMTVIICRDEEGTDVATTFEGTKEN
ncbi:MAG: type II secretion system protein [Lachnospiraceae bacterium]|nr:type II secretion system protein [Lachnospiraceae bacterium]